MKKLTFYFLISLFFITNVLADQLVVSDIKLGTKLTDYFSTAQISEYNINDKPATSPYFSYDGKYSWFKIVKESNLYKDNYDKIDINYANNNDEIANIGAISDTEFDNSNGFNKCIKTRNQKVSEYKKKNMLIGVNKITQKVIHPDKVKEDTITFKNTFKRTYISFSCLDYSNHVLANPDKKYAVDFRIDYFTQDFNEWLLEQEKKHNN
jgi:hypothetical protein